MLHAAAASDQPMQQSHEIETDETVPNEEEVVLNDDEPSSQLDDAVPQSNDEEDTQDVQLIDVGIVSEEEEANTDQTLEKTRLSN